MHQGTNHQEAGSPYVFVVFFLTKHLKTYPIPKTRHTPHPWVWSRSGSCFSKLVLEPGWNWNPTNIQVNWTKNVRGIGKTMESYVVWRRRKLFQGRKKQAVKHSDVGWGFETELRSYCWTQSCSSWAGMTMIPYQECNITSPLTNAGFCPETASGSSIKGSVPCIPSASLIVPAISHKSTSARLSGCFCLGFARIFPFEVLFFVC